MLIGLALAVALKRIAKVESERACLWQWHPSAAYLGKCKEVPMEIPRTLSDAADLVENAVDLTTPQQRDRGAPAPRGITITMQASIATAELAIDIDIYSDEEVPRALGITDEPAAVIAEPRGYIGEESVDSFYQLAASEEAADHLRQLAKELYRQAAATHLKAATYAGVRQYALSDLVAWVKASRNYALDLRNAIPLYYNPWRRHLARDMYALAPEKYKRLAGPAGMRILWGA